MDITDFEVLDFVDFLQGLLVELEPEDQDIVQRAIDGGREGYCALSDAQRHRFDEIVDMNTVEHCERCGVPIPWDDMIAARNSGGYCSYCRYNMPTLDDED